MAKSHRDGEKKETIKIKIAIIDKKNIYITSALAASKKRKND